MDKLITVAAFDNTLGTKYNLLKDLLDKAGVKHLISLALRNI